MPPAARSSTEQLAAVLRRCLRKGVPVEISGLGIFNPTPDGGFEFLPASRPKVFIAYVEEDHGAANRIFDYLEGQGFEPWLDTRRLLAGQNWPRAIEQAMELSDFVVVCFSTHAVFKKGHFQSELRYALDCARRLPMDDTFLIPVRLEECPIPARIRHSIQYVDLFPDWQSGLGRVVSAMRQKANAGCNHGRQRDLLLTG
ncbi:MAG: toll/interleukin-1 receptor domain-containing protein [Bryobacterales bacterium]|nr:toll/interleukin-1 receptor domain-containing protein [Bryobacterales bacterium]